MIAVWVQPAALSAVLCTQTAIMDERQRPPAAGGRREAPSVPATAARSLKVLRFHALDGVKPHENVAQTAIKGGRGRTWGPLVPICDTRGPRVPGDKLNEQYAFGPARSVPLLNCRAPKPVCLPVGRLSRGTVMGTVCQRLIVGPHAMFHWPTKVKCGPRLCDSRSWLQPSTCRQARRHSPKIRVAGLTVDGFDLLRFLAQDAGGYDIRCTPWT